MTLPSPATRLNDVLPGNGKGFATDRSMIGGHRHGLSILCRLDREGQNVRPRPAGEFPHLKDDFLYPRIVVAGSQQRAAGKKREADGREQADEAYVPVEAGHGGGFWHGGIGVVEYAGWWDGGDYLRGPDRVNRNGRGATRSDLLGFARLPRLPKFHLKMQEYAQWYPRFPYLSAIPH